MWLFSRDGFYSAVKDKYCNDGELMIRARIKVDLERLLEKIESDDEILTFGHADYRYRVKIKAYQWIKYVAKEAADIDYDDVKDTSLRLALAFLREQFHLPSGRIQGTS